MRGNSITVALSLGTTDPAGARALGWGLNAESLRVRDDPAVQTVTQIRDHLRAYVDRERSARIARQQRDLDPPRDPLVGDWPSLMEKREREYRIFGHLQALAAEAGFEAGYDSELDARLKQEGFTLSEQGTIRRRIENGYLRDLGRPAHHATVDDRQILPGKAAPDWAGRASVRLPPDRSRTGWREASCLRGRRGRTAVHASRLDFYGVGG